MVETSRHDAWQLGDSYEAYMGRWSRPIAARFLDWLGAPAGKDWLDVGCGTGALSSAILQQCRPNSLIAIDASEGFVAKARQAVQSPIAEFKVGNAEALPLDAASRDAVASALVLNFVPDRVKALSEMKRVTRPGGMIGFYVWDYPGRGVEFMHAFWTAAIALDPGASDLAEGKRFPFCTPEGLMELAEKAGLQAVEWTAIESPSVFRDFEDFWHPFTLGAGPAPGYCVKLAPDARQRLRDKLEESLPHRKDGSITLNTRAWALKAQV